MTEAIYIVTKLLLIFLFQTGSHVKDLLVCADARFDIKYSCGADIVCFYLWNFGTTDLSGFIGIISNGEMMTSESPGDQSKCSFPYQHLSVQDAGRHYCRKELGIFRRYLNAPVLNLTPDKPASLQCVYMRNTDHCYHGNYKVRLTWVDESGAQIKSDSQHQIHPQSSCSVTLQMTLKTPQQRTLRCQVTVGNIIQTSGPFLIQLPEGKEKRILDETEHHERNQQDMMGVAVGVVGCVVMTALITAFVVKKRRTRTNVQPSDESLNAVNPNNNVSESDMDDVIYTEIMFPVNAAQIWMKECEEETEYSTVRY